MVRVEGFAYILDALTGKIMWTLSGSDATYISAAFSADGKRIVTGSRLPNSAKIWNVQTGKEIRTFIGHKGSVTSAAFSPDGQRIVTGSADKTAKIWNVQTGK